MKARRKSRPRAAKPTTADEFAEQGLDKKNEPEKCRKYSIDLPEWLYKKLKRESLNKEVTVRKIILEELTMRYQ